MDEITYEIMITYTAGGCSETVVIPVTLKNPCIDSELVEIIAPPILDTLEYIIGSGKMDYPPHEPFVIQNSNIDGPFTLCGPISYEACYEG